MIQLVLVMLSFIFHVIHINFQQVAGNFQFFKKDLDIHVLIFDIEVQCWKCIFMQVPNKQ